MDNNPAITELEILERDLTEKLKNVQGSLAMLKLFYGNRSASGGIAGSIDKYSDYNRNANFREKVQYIFKKENRFLHVREIAELLHELEPRMSVKDVLDKLSPAISYFKKQGAVVKVVVGNSNLNTFWGSKNWVDNDGEPKEQHKYNVNQLNKPRKPEDIDI